MTKEYYETTIERNKRGYTKTLEILKKNSAKMIEENKRMREAFKKVYNPNEPFQPQWTKFICTY